MRGDDVRSIDWRATASAGTTMLRTWRPERDRHVVIVIDTGRTSAARVGDGTRLDAAMEAALLLSALATRAGDHVHLVMFDRVVRARVTGVDGPALLPALVDAMAPVEPQLIDTDWDGALGAGARAHLPPVADRAAHRAGRPGGRPRIPRLAAHRDAQGEGRRGNGDRHGAARASARSRERGDDVYRAAAAEHTLRDAARVASAVERAGADAIAAGPEDLPVRIADRYLELKARRASVTPDCAVMTRPWPFARVFLSVA